MEALTTLFLHHIPEACFFALAGLGLVGFKTAVRQWFPFVLAFGIVVHVARLQFFPWHVPVLAALQAVAQRYYFRISWVTSIGAVFVSLILLNLGEAMIALAVFPILSLSAQQVLHDPGLYVAIGWGTQIPLVVATLGVYRWGWVILPLHGDGGGAGVERSATGEKR